MLYAYLNDFSMYLPDGKTLPAWPLLHEVMEISSVLKNDYEIELIKVPNDFKSRKIGNTHSIVDLLALPEEDMGILEKQSIYGFLANRVIDELDEVEIELLKEIEKKKWIEVKYLTTYSMYLTGAYLLQTAIISFQTQENFKVDSLVCELCIEFEENKTKSKPAQIANIYSTEQLVKHHPYLIKIKNDITFGRGNWNPHKSPIWNNKTKILIQEMEFPQSINGKKNKISELKEVGGKIAILNCWKPDKFMTDINSNSGQKRMVFISESKHGPYYLSIDLKNAYGRFELHNSKGKHLGEIDFEAGDYVPRGKSKTGQDDSGQHDLKMERSRL